MDVGDCDSREGLRVLAITVDVDAGITGEGGEWEHPRRL